MSSQRPSPPDVGIVIVAAGRGERLGTGGAPKQFRELAGLPIVLWAVRPFLAHPAVHALVLVLPPADAASPPPWLAELAGERLILVPGGPERTDSVRAGLVALPAAASVVLVHDGARPFPDPGVIDTVVVAARRGRSAIAALPVSDTLKRGGPPLAGRAPVVEQTVVRDGLWRAQTPQGFPRAVLERAYAASPPGTATDDAAMVELLGEPVALVLDSPFNLKITTQADLALAEVIARDRRHAPVPQ